MKHKGGKMGGSGKPGFNLKGDSVSKGSGGSKQMAAGKSPSGKPMGKKSY